MLVDYDAWQHVGCLPLSEPPPNSLYVQPGLKFGRWNLSWLYREGLEKLSGDFWFGRNRMANRRSVETLPDCYRAIECESCPACTVKSPHSSRWCRPVWAGFLIFWPWPKALLSKVTGGEHWHGIIPL